MSVRSDMHRLLHEAETKPVGTTQQAVMTYLSRERKGVEVEITDLARDPSFRGVHYSKVMSAVEALAKKGLIRKNGSQVSLA